MVRISVGTTRVIQLTIKIYFPKIDLVSCYAHLIVLAFVLVVSGSRPTPPSILKTDILLQLDLATKLSQCSDDER